ncbi:hypothetical protein PSENEW3_00001242 [Picochlorum sp. SENEW3]|nr:hypothetical protein PSENEW3_00001242 [Picochlorum sp. SENEW3]
MSTYTKCVSKGHWITSDVHFLFSDFPDDYPVVYRVELLREIQDEQTFEKLVEKKGFVSKKKKKEEDTIEEVRQQRRRGLGWLAVVTGIAVWATGLVNSLNPL